MDGYGPWHPKGRYFFPLAEKSKTSFVKLKYTILANSSFKAQLPTFREGLIKEFLQFIHEFKHAKDKLRCSTYQKLESGIYH